MPKDTSRTNNGDGTVTETTTWTKSDGSGRSHTHTYEPGIVFDDTISRSDKTIGPSKKD